jgi:hypothetical protein
VSRRGYRINTQRLPVIVPPELSREEKRAIRDKARRYADDPRQLPAMRTEYREMAERLTAELEE